MTYSSLAMHEINYDIFELIFNFVPDKLSVEIVDV